MRYAICIALTLLLAACSKKPDAQKVAKDVRSWRASVQTAATMMRDRKLPPRYVRQVAEAAEDELTKEKSTDAQTRGAITAAQSVRSECERR